MAALESQLRVSSQLEEGDVKKSEGETPKNQHGKETEGILLTPSFVERESQREL